MTVKLEPRTVDKIRQFDRRRRGLILLRGVCALLTLGIVTLAVVAFVDYFIFMEDWVRTVLSVVAYGMTAVVVYVTSIRYLNHRESMRELARLFESVSPELRENLLSAVELGDPKTDLGLDSVEFREILQKDVADRLDAMKMESVLPGKLIVRWVKATAAVCVLIASLFAIPGLRFGTLFLRAAAPMANIERVSDIRIEILEPTPAEGVIPQGDSIPIVVKVSDNDIERVYLESIPSGEKKTKVRMDSVGGGRFSTALNVGRKSHRYRVRAGTGLTKYYTLQALPRPQVVSFKKTYTFPKYSLLKPNVITGKDGNIEVLEGTKVEIVAHTDQPVRKAAIRLETADNVRKLPMVIRNGREIRAHLTVKRSATYRIQLISATTGFDNKFSPRYEIRAKADLVPSIAITRPKTDIAVPRDDIIDVSGVAKDDLGFRSVDLHYRINGGRWDKIQIVDKPAGQKVLIGYRWDLAELSLRPGDEILMKLGCVDLRKSSGTSAAYRVTITSVGFDEDRLAQLKRWHAVRTSLETLRNSSNNLRTRANEASGKLPQTKDAAVRKQVILTLSAAAQKTTEDADSANSRIKQVLPGITNRRASADMLLSGRVVSHIHRTSFESASDRLLKTLDQTTDRQNLDVREIQQMATTGSGHSTTLLQAFDWLLADQEAQAIQDDLKRMQMEQQQIIEMAKALEKDLDSAERIQRRQNVITKNVQVLDEMAAKLSTRVSGNARNDTQNMRRQFKYTLDKTTRALARRRQSGQGKFQVEFFADKVLEKSVYKREDGQIDFLWEGQPDQSVPADGFSARWRGFLRPRRSGEYTFITTSDDGVRLWIDEKLVIDDWSDHSTREKRGQIELDSKRNYKLRLEYYDDVMTARIKLEWETERMRRTRVLATKMATYDLKPIAQNLRYAASSARQLSKNTQKLAADARKRLRAILGPRAKSIKEAAEAMRKAAETQKKKDAKPEEKTAAKEKAKEKLKAAAKKLKDRAELEESRKRQDTAFVKDAAQAAAALEQIKEEAKTTQKMEEQAKAVEKVEEAFKKLEAGHELKEITKQLNEMAVAEKWDKQDPQKARESARAWKKVEDDMEAFGKDAPRKEDPVGKAVKALEDISRSKDAKAVENEMRQRGSREEAKKKLSEPLENLRNAVARENNELKKAMKEARKSIDDQAPTLDNQIQKLQKMAEDAKKATEELAEKAKNGKTEETQAQAQKLKKGQEKLNDKIEDIRDALRRDANAQDLTTEEGRERARDADDALAMLKDSPEKAEEHLQQAAAEDDKGEQKQNLEKAAEQQKQTADALKQIAEHVENMEKGKPQPTRQGLRDKEKELGIAEKLDKQYKQLEKLAEAKTPEEAMAQLEEQLKQDKAMQKELDNIAKDAAQAGEQGLKDVARKEQKVEKDLNGLDKWQERQEQAQQRQMQELKKGTEDLANNKVPQLQKQANNKNKGQLDESKRAAENAKQAARNTDQMHKAAEELKKAQDALNKAAQKSQGQQQQQAKGAAKQAGDLSKKAADLAKQMERKEQHQEHAMAQGNKQQVQAQEQAQEAAADLERAARHEQRLGNKEDAEQLQQIAEQTQGMTRNEMPQASKALQNSQAPAQAKAPVAAATDAAENAAKAMEDFNQKSARQSQQADSQQSEAAKWLARALDQLDQSQQQQQGQQQKAQPGQQQAQAMANAQAAMAQAQQAQAQAMAEQRTQQGSGGPKDTDREIEFKKDEVAIKTKGVNDKGDWTRLPKRLARELKSARHEAVPEQYRKMVNTYFKVIAQRSRKTSGENE